MEAGEVRATASAFGGARALGVHDLGHVCHRFGADARPFLQKHDHHADHRIWQDVYHAKLANGCDVYLKLTVIDGILIVSFKEL